MILSNVLHRAQTGKKEGTPKTHLYGRSASYGESSVGLQRNLILQAQGEIVFPVHYVQAL